MKRKGAEVAGFRIGNPYLLDGAREVAGEQRLERTFIAPGLSLGTSAFTADRWEGTFYPVGMKVSDRLKYYSTRFQTVGLFRPNQALLEDELSLGLSD